MISHSELDSLSDPGETLLERGADCFLKLAVFALAEHLSSLENSNDFILIQLAVTIKIKKLDQSFYLPISYLSLVPLAELVLLNKLIA